jgi:ferredoxin-NADP reductase
VHVDLTTRRLEVMAVRDPAERIRELRLADPSGADLPSWEPGAHIDLVLPSGLVRQYSLCGDPADRSVYRIAVLLDMNGRGGSREIHESDLLGTSVGIRGPRNHFALVAAPNYLFIAGGVGVTPLLTQVRHASQAGARWTFAYGARTRNAMAFVDELERLPGGAVALYPEDEVGLIPLDDLLRSVPHGLVYCCGPEPMIAAVERACGSLGRRHDLHFERFAPAAEKPPPEDGLEDFEVEISSTGEVFQIPADRSILEVLREVRGDLMSSCEEGFCGACEVGVVAGLPAHRDTILTDEDHEKSETMMICVGRSKTPRLVLDL